MGANRMIRLARRASLLVAFSLLASAATAYAECAWVLWNEVQMSRWEKGKLPEDSTGWITIGGYETKANCDRERAEKVADWKKDKDMKITGNIALRSVMTEGSGWSRTMRVVCLPDGTDPRGPKGKRTTPTLGSGIPGSASTASCA